MVKNKKLAYVSEELEEPQEQVKKLKEKLKSCQKEKEEHLTQAQRARADLINFRRRQEEILEKIRIYGQADFIRELLPVLDSLKSGAEKNEGIRQITEQIQAILKKYGLKEIEALGQKFNPEFHEAVEQVKSKKKEGTIIKEVQKGYLLADKVLKPSKVKVSK